MSLVDLRNDHEERTWAERQKEPFSCQKTQARKLSQIYAPQNQGRA